ncbi:hypothetical protein C7M84_019723 [Penaeus vannamei]|uniref:RIMS-binding protein 1/2/3 Fn3 domain-containing protein n=1 Tax=Penaeus vannamei TaxID=6689 RepID=A0A3R7PDR0_PENVA|nr:hypothetical protein C7M84_019723 [Penaeus vannamei]
MFGTCSPPFPPGLPDPPVDVQVEPGPQDGSLLVTWLPVTINSTGGTSNGAPVTGYAVYADGKKVTENSTNHNFFSHPLYHPTPSHPTLPSTPPPLSTTGDHALIDLTKIPGFEPKQVTVRTKSRDSVSGDSVPSQIPSHFARDEAEGSSLSPHSRQLEEEEAMLHSDMDRPSELSDIAEESETELSDEVHEAAAVAARWSRGSHSHPPSSSPSGHACRRPQARPAPWPRRPPPRPPGQHHGPPGGPHHGPPGPGGLRDRLLGRRGAPAPGVRTDHLGQTILDHEDNLSDKEIYPGHQQGQMAPQTSIPAIGESRGVRQPPPPPSRPRPSHARVRRRGGEHAWARGDRRRTAASLAFLLLTCCRSVLLLITEHLRTLAWQTLTHEPSQKRPRQAL